MNPTQVNQDVANARAQGQALQTQFNTQAGQQYGSYQGAQNQANAAYGNLQSYTNSLQDPASQYNQYLKSAQGMYGFDPTSLLRANQNLANTQTTLANLPQAVQQQGNYYGTTAGAQANNFTNQAGNLQNVLAGQSNTVNAFQNVLAATQQQANQQASLGLQGQQLKMQGLSNLYSNALTQMQTAGQVLNNLQNLQANQGALTAQQVSAYQNAYSTYIQAQAQAGLASAQAQQIRQQIDFMNQVQQKYGVAGIANSMGVPQNVTNQPNTGLGVIAPGNSGVTDARGNVIGVYNPSAPRTANNNPSSIFDILRGATRRFA